MRSPTADRLPMLVASVGFHVALFWAVGFVPPREHEERGLIQFEVAEVPRREPDPPKPKPKEPEPEPKKEDEKEKEPEPIVKPKVQTKTKPQPPPPAPAPPTKFRLPPSQLVPPGEGAGVQVDPGLPSDSGTDPRGRDDGKKNGKPGGTGTGGAQATGSGTGGSGPPWSPTSELYIKQLPGVANAPPKLQCPATREGITGTVVLKIQIRKDGSMRHVKIAKGIGGGCDEIAVKALKKAKFRPAIATDGKPADYELRYEYVFRAAD